MVSGIELNNDEINQIIVKAHGELIKITNDNIEIMKEISKIIPKEWDEQFIKICSYLWEDIDSRSEFVLNYIKTEYISLKIPKELESKLKDLIKKYFENFKEEVINIKNGLQSPAPALEYYYPEILDKVLTIEHHNNKEQDIIEIDYSQDNPEIYLIQGAVLSYLHMMWHSKKQSISDNFIELHNTIKDFQQAKMRSF